ncbi:uncharacterized protein LOC110197447 [Phascolarctos cinereus]|uniref:Uncharacterized protein LOC110197447 n=1 Tax=Phascolarctos cinereus TaxID=38626 RepID=A0A6P5J1A1_PHACI|nr:uncharacterized protein LOC110197447 [Phascolarctos cinereus]XP_020827059.1 uncharacterized protein LOC110197447 [Phascolarctos cinereus]XP_020827068.1 uncharacterized protein LOC110197447 [Phascolarctos cinereus]XP_020827075.1 uncharacterized protein LOC110197447 [Phascolarctos cinereus]XP_020827083.1 uncharacterized protein LOC110197447 [Phascolarctos cinereus]XP_020827088.1 uncharacterized protein LOC110197447 [Phascolarctos cinereus]
MQPERRLGGKGGAGGKGRVSRSPTSYRGHVPPTSLPPHPRAAGSPATGDVSRRPRGGGGVGMEPRSIQALPHRDTMLRSNGVGVSPVPAGRGGGAPDPVWPRGGSAGPPGVPPPEGGGAREGQASRRWPRPFPAPFRWGRPAPHLCFGRGLDALPSLRTRRWLVARGQPGRGETPPAARSAVCRSLGRSDKPSPFGSWSAPARPHRLCYGAELRADEQIMQARVLPAPESAHQLRPDA